MTAVEKLSAVVRANSGKKSQEVLDPMYGLAASDCSELLQEIDRLRDGAMGFQDQAIAYRAALLEANRRRRSVREACARICDERAKINAKDLNYLDGIRGEEAESCAAAIRAGGKS